jgi:XTP/dITP diphosphohydrolase
VTADGLLLLATRSAGKLRELEPIFQAAGFRVTHPARLGLPELPDEEGVEAFDTFDENAIAKARYFATRSGLPSVADDSGLEVLSLGGAPGVRSKRWSGRTDLAGQALDDANNLRLLEALRGSDDTRAQYVCAAAYVGEGRELVVRGTTAGRIVAEPRGGGGFGYDPYFYSDELGRTFGEASREEKERVSHRGRAMRELLVRLRDTSR